MGIKEIISTTNPQNELEKILEEIHKFGPEKQETLEKLSYYKKFHPDCFNKYEEEILSALGLFYKIEKPQTIYSILMSGFGISHISDHGACLTPVQASIRRAIDNYQYSSISAPTSAGKSYSVRDFISQSDGDTAIIVPSRALIAEYIESINRKFYGDKNVMVTSFVDVVYTSRKMRRVFILTPERSKDLFHLKDKIDIKTFFFDEAQISEEIERGVIFDTLVRRASKHFPNAKLIFAHPFVENPEAQLQKHGIDKTSFFAKSYNQGSVGRLCIYQHSNGNYYYFSPHERKGHLIKNTAEFSGSFKEFSLNRNHSILIYVSKSSIYNGKFSEEFKDYIGSIEDTSNPDALEIINEIEYIVGANSTNHKSEMISLLKKGVVIHHGSIPLEVRFLIEKFIRDGHATLCFATSTLAQGINMPFDIVWLDNNRFNGDENERALAFKNLIGRAGRLSQEKKFDFGYVYTNKPDIFIKRINTSFKLKNLSIIDDENSQKQTIDSKELLDSIRNDTYDEDKDMPKSKVSRLSSTEIMASAAEFLNILFRTEKISTSIGGGDNKNYRLQATICLMKIFEASIGRGITDAESSVFNNAIRILFHTMQGRSFREIVGIRYNYISSRDDAETIYAKYSQPAEKIPNINLKKYSIFKKNTLASKVSYDAIVFDTYDYLDQVISFSLSDVFIAAFKIFNDKTGDPRALKAIDIFRYGTNDKTHILLMRYGFPPEAINDIIPYIDSISESEIRFNENIASANKSITKLVEWYRP